MAGGSGPRRRGDAFERKIRAELEAKGWYVIRSSGSRTAVDLAAFPTAKTRTNDSGKLTLLLQLKLGGVIGKAESAELVTTADDWAIPVLATRDGYFRLPGKERMEL